MNKTRLFLEKMIFLHDFEEYWIHLCRSSLHPFLVNATLVFSLAFNFRKSYRQQHQVLRKSSSDYISSYSTSFLKKRDADNHLINIYNEPVLDISSHCIVTHEWIQILCVTMSRTTWRKMYQTAWHRLSLTLFTSKTIHLIITFCTCTDCREWVHYIPTYITIVCIPVSSFGFSRKSFFLPSHCSPYHVGRTTVFTKWLLLYHHND